ncbi:ATP-binding protein [Kitasatospora sp. NPDC086791]|uniref:ATP-binding protein n=1 Tax=Kitasatospora sp. NPDC086791 TaxID=3155178 RepID=UPI0034216765
MLLLPLVRPPDDDSDGFRLDLFLPAAPQVVGAVRRFLRDLLSSLGLDPGTACLLLSELVSNAILHGGVPTVVLELRPGFVYIAVADRAPGELCARCPELDSTTGRGLFLVDQLADEWGVEEIDSYGKAVWALAPTPAAA